MDHREPGNVEIKNFLIDIDGTVCEDIPNEQEELFPNAAPLEGAVERVNALYDQGHHVTFFTSRTSEHRAVTLEWLIRHGFKFHALLTDKPRGGNYFWIDNLDVNGIKFKGDWKEIKIG